MEKGQNAMYGNNIYFHLSYLVEDYIKQVYTPLIHNTHTHSKLTSLTHSLLTPPTPTHFSHRSHPHTVHTAHTHRSRRLRIFGGGCFRRLGGGGILRNPEMFGNYQCLCIASNKRKFL